jgi:DNA-directed RNA polymerase I subunit RPA2
VAGFSVTAEKLNYFRYLSHFQAVHRGAFFATVKTTAVRKLFPESWGFFCPVHTPDGAPCGLLNHLAQHCKVVPTRADTSGVREIMVRVGMRAAGRGVVPLAGATMPVMLDGAVIGYVSSDPKQVSLMEATLRSIKVKGLGPPPARMARSEDIKAAKVSREKLREALAAGLELPALECEKSATPYLPEDMEMVFVRPGIEGTLPHAGLYFFSTPGRMMRPVKNLSEGAMELIGTMEQVFLNIAVDERDVTDGVSTHMEGDPTTILSTVAALTPFSDYNQSPRNMYQCQMAKQTIGTPAQAIAHRSDNKAYRLQTPQSPLVRNKMHHVVDFDDYPHGANAVVAVLSYTGYDMEDAMIIKKGSFERGFAAASVYTCLPYDLVKLADAPALCAAMRFGNYLNPDDDPSSPGCVSGARVPGKKIVEALDDDGLPPVGLKLATGDPFLCYINDATGAVTLVRHKSVDPAVVDRVAVFGDRGTLNAADGKVRGLTGRPITASTGIRRVTVKLRYDRNPIIGDKFASRHGQKGVLSVFYPDADMPFTESGIQPDIIINPHAFPSRMTIGMLIESMAAKSGSLLGLHFDSTPFQFDEKDRAVDHFGQQLLKSGFNYYGNEPMYSGIHGTEMAADVFIGIVYYQRLRHMVSDKFQVRTHGPVDPCTHQPVKGRKKGGGVRFGEMERDSLIAHGASFLLQDRLLNCSDKHRMLACTLCGSVVSVLTLPAAHAGAPSEPICRTCNSDAHVQLIQVPFVFKFMVNELISCNIKVELGVRQPKI